MSTLESLHPGGFELTRRTLEACSVRPGVRLADLGCGSGASLAYLRREYRIEALGFDLCFDAMQAGSAVSLGLYLACAGGCALPLAAHSCDIVLAECSLSAMGDLAAALSECQRVLAPGGRLAIHDLYRRKTGSSLFPPGRSGWIALLDAAGFNLLVWEDHTPALTALAAQAIFAGRSLASLWGCRPVTALSRSDLRSLGYFLAVAETCKSDPVGMIDGDDTEERLRWAQSSTDGRRLREDR